MRRIVALGSTAALLVAGLVAGTGSAAAAPQELISLDFENRVLQPGEGWAELGPTGAEYDGEGDSATFAGTLVYALSKAPLNDPAFTQAGLPAGLTVDLGTYEPACRAGSTRGVYLCTISDENPFPEISVQAAGSTAHGTTLHYGVAYVPSGGDLAKGTKEAQTAATQPEDGRHAARTVTVKSLEHVRQNTLALTTPTLPAGGSATHSVTLHAVDEGRLDVGFEPAPGMREWEEDELGIEITGVSATSGTAQCDHSTGDIGYGGVYCDVDPGTSGPVDVTVSYTLKAASTAAAWKINTWAVYEVYDWGLNNPETARVFSVQSTRPVPTHHALLARDKSGRLYWNHGTGRATAPFRDYSEQVGTGWHIYNAVTKLAPITVQATGGGVVGRDTSGVLWSYRTTGDSWQPLTARVRVGGGWGIYNNLTGVADVTGDGRADLIARDTSGVLWLYKGTTSTTAPFAPRTRIGGGWQIYNQLTAVGDVTGDRRADLVARDSSGVLWLYKGTGSATTPYAARTRIGGGWQIYPQVSAPGDLTDDGRADLIARDGSGVYWLYKGTGSATTPYAARVRVTVGEMPSTVNLLF